MHVALERTDEYNVRSYGFCEVEGYTHPFVRRYESKTTDSVTWKIFDRDAGNWGTVTRLTNPELFTALENEAERLKK